MLGVCYIDAIGWHSSRWIYLIRSYRTKSSMCKFNDILIWECWETKQAKEGKLGLRNTKTGWFNVKKDKYTPKRRNLKNQISQHGHCLCLVIQSCRGQEYASWSTQVPWRGKRDMGLELWESQMVNIIQHFLSVKPTLKAFLKHTLLLIFGYIIPTC